MQVTSASSDRSMHAAIQQPEYLYIDNMAKQKFHLTWIYLSLATDDGKVICCRKSIDMITRSK